MSRIRSQLSYANVMATVAVFIALGGTSYAVSQLPRNSVGAPQIRTGAVGNSELRSGAVRSKHIKNRSIGLRDVSIAARRSLRGQRGPTGPVGPQGPSASTFSVAVRPTGEYARSRGIQSTGAGHDSGSGVYTIAFNADVSACFAAATIAGIDGVEPDDGQIVASIAGERATVRTRDFAGNATDLPFHLIVSC